MRSTWCCASSRGRAPCPPTDDGADATGGRIEEATMKTSNRAVSISGDMHEKLDAIAAAGIAGLEIFEHEFMAVAGTHAHVGRMVLYNGTQHTLLQQLSAV